MSDKNVALRMNNDIRRIISAGNRAAAKIGLRVISRGIREFRRNRTVNEDILISSLMPLLVDAMMLGYLLGKRRMLLLVPSMQQLSISVYQKALRFLRKKAALSTVELELITTFYQTSALEVAARVSNKVQGSLGRAMTQITKEGLTVRQGTTKLREAYAAQGITPRNSFTLEAVFRTQTQLAYSAGRWEAEQDPAVQEILWGYKYVTVGDSRVRESHVELEGTTLPKDDPFWDTNRPPNGWACRCQAIPLFEERSIQQPKGDGADIAFQFNPGTVLNPRI